MVEGGEQKVNIRREIELFLRRSGMRPARFGRLAARDPRLVFDIRAGWQSTFLDAAGAHPDHLNSLDDLRRFPFIDKRVLRDRPGAATSGGLGSACAATGACLPRCIAALESSGKRARVL